MTIMKEFYEKVKAEIEENQKAGQENQELPPELTDEMKSRLTAHVCIFCGSLEVAMWRAVDDVEIEEILHCLECERNWSTSIPHGGEMIVVNEIFNNWLHFFFEHWLEEAIE
ncbi:MAG: hypothetical protein JEZ11_18505 [Desulfobacterales bacterium]|nr:hypothetical protein [Desulfobacterales bacterium]